MASFSAPGIGRSLLVAHAGAALAALAACAAPGNVGAVPVEARVLVKLVRAEADPAAIAAEAARRAGVPVRYGAAAGAAWHALVLQCADAAGCEAAIVRLRSAAATYQAVERDARRQPA